MAVSVDWQEGMLLLPQHLTFQQQQLAQDATQKMRAITPFAYGVLQLTIDRTCLQVGQVSITKCQAIMPDGQCVDAPHHDDLPAPLSFKQTREPITIGVKVDGTIAQQITLQQQTIPIKKAQLTLVTNETTHSNWLPLLRIQSVDANHQIRLQTDFVTPCLQISANETLGLWVEEIHALLQHQSNLLAYRLTENNQPSSYEVTDLLMLQLVNKYLTQFQSLLATRHCHPVLFYQLLITLYGELCSFTTHERQPQSIPSYDHQDLNHSFGTVMNYLRPCLNLVTEQHAQYIPLEQTQAGYWQAILPPTTLNSNNYMVLAIDHAQEASEVTTPWQDCIKVAPLNRLDDLISRALPGIELETMPTAPRQIPFKPQRHYLLMDNNSPLWGEFDQSRTLAIHIAAAFNQEVELWSIRQ